MSEKNVELVRRLYASLDQGDDDAFWDLVPPAFVADFSRRLINPVVLRGRDQARAFGEREREIWDQGQIDWEPEELIDAGDKVLAFIRTGGRGKASGVRVEARVWNVWTFRDGRPIEWAYFGDDRALAFEAAGLEERALSEKNVEITRRGFDAFNRGDLDGTLQAWAPDAVWDWSNSHGFDAGVFRGHGEIRAFAERFFEAFEEVRLELGDATEIEDGLLIVENVAHFRGRGDRNSGSQRLAGQDSGRQADFAHALPDEAGSPRSRRPAGARHTRRLLSVRHTAAGDGARGRGDDPQAAQCG